MQFLLRLLLLLSLAACCANARADLLIYKLDNTSRGGIVLQGKVTANPGGTVSFIHPKFGTLYFGLKDVEIHRLPTTREQFARMVAKAKDAPAMFDAAVWALKHGLLSEHYDAVDRTLKLD